ncbi:hypothetical protein PGN35_007875 [Nodosilinea sp. PGN35]|uniref:hypothetical protein n=1 Tax=Nodosilinea sp. PGN35 TaxID=3020489 RepID=UPI00398B54FB
MGLIHPLRGTGGAQGGGAVAQALLLGAIASGGAGDTPPLPIAPGRGAAWGGCCWNPPYGPHPSADWCSWCPGRRRWRGGTGGAGRPPPVRWRSLRGELGGQWPRCCRSGASVFRAPGSCTPWAFR